MRNWDVNKEMKGWRMEGRFVLLPCVDGGDKEVFNERCFEESMRAVSTFYSRAMQLCVCIFFLFTSEKGTRVKSEKEQCDTEKGHDGKACRMVKEK